MQNLCYRAYEAYDGDENCEGFVWLWDDAEDNFCAEGFKLV